MPDRRFANVRWLFFDWGGTLFNEDGGIRNLAKSVAELAEAADTEVSEQQFFDAMLAAEFAEETDKIGVALNEIVADEGVRSAIQSGLDLERSWSPEYPGLTKTLSVLSGRYSMGLISNTRPGFDRRLETMGIRQLIDVRVGSGDVGVSKPDPAIFRLAMERADCVASESLMIGDRPDKDIAGANAVGMSTIRIRQGIYVDQEPATPDEHPDAEVTDIRELPGLLL